MFGQASGGIFPSCRPVVFLSTINIRPVFFSRKTTSGQQRSGLPSNDNLDARKTLERPAEWGSACNTSQGFSTPPLTEPSTPHGGQTWFRYQPPSPDIGAPADSAEPSGAESETRIQPRQPDPDLPAADPGKFRPRRRQPPRRARISFEAPLRLKARLDRLARELDRSRTTLLRDGLSRYLAELAAKGDES